MSADPWAADGAAAPREGAPDDVGVVGAGAVGLTAARDLAARGVDVTVYERAEPGAGASGRAAGVLYDAYADRRDADVARRALERFRALDGTGEFAFTERPYVWLARAGDDQRADAVRETAGRMREAGVDAAVLDPAALRERFPGVAADDVAVAAVTPNAGHADTGAYVDAVAGLAREAGVDLRTGARATIETAPPAVVAGGERTVHDAVLVAAGAHTKAVLADAGVAVPLKPYRVQALTAAVDYDGPMCYDASGGFYLRPHPTGLLAGDGTEEREVDPDDWDRGADDWFVDEVAGGLDRRVGVDASDPERAWAGLCVATPDRDPLLGPVADGVHVAAGWQGHGFMRAPALGEHVAAVVLGGDPPAGFEPARFDGDEEFQVVEGMAVE
jgi:sarcosine oxidase subunit beta